MSDSVRPHRRQPTRLPRPWDSPGKNTGMGCHFLLQCMKVKSESEVAQSCLTLSDPMDYSLPGSSVHEIFQARGVEWVAIAFSRLSTHAHIIPKAEEIKEGERLGGDDDCSFNICSLRAWWPHLSGAGLMFRCAVWGDCTHCEWSWVL